MFERLHADIRGRLSGDIAAFLLSRYSGAAIGRYCSFPVHDANPDFNLIGLPGAANLPAIRWKLINLEKLKGDNPGKHAVHRGALEDLFL